MSATHLRYKNIKIINKKHETAVLDEVRKLDNMEVVENVNVEIVNFPHRYIRGEIVLQYGFYSDFLIKQIQSMVMGYAGRHSICDPFMVKMDLRRAGNGYLYGRQGSLMNQVLTEFNY